ncbi:MAG: histidine--tRNA ligase [Alphaproteobacteria bacterium]|nr:histidine--tRNA ligase [Alphaproteobacteria bacterium]
MNKNDKKKIYKPKQISGFPEWLPEIRRTELLWFDHIRTTFESYGFCPIETPSVEELDAINAKGGDGEADVDKEVYVLERLHKEDGDKEARLALHFDQTVPLARYTAQHFNDLVFPFKRYQMQRVWRGERPQAGRFREFYQCDIDVINVDTLPLHFDAEMPAIIWEILSSLPGMENEKIQIRISNRKILMGLLQACGVSDVQKYTSLIDKLEKIGNEEVEIGLKLNLRLDELHEDFANLFLDLAEIKTAKGLSGLLRDFITRNDVIARSVSDEAIQIMQEGIEELAFVLDQLSHLPEGSVVADLSIVRGLDYYTGTVYETVFTDDPAYGSICSGGRYDDLASNYINKKLPGVGISIGFSRLFDRIRSQGKLPKLGISPADILICLPEDEARGTMMETAQTLRKNGYKVETFHSASKIKRQLAYAEKKGIPYVWFPPFSGNPDHEVKNMLDGTQSKADPQNWKDN